MRHFELFSNSMNIWGPKDNIFFYKGVNDFNIFFVREEKKSRDFVYRFSCLEFSYLREMPGGEIMMSMIL